MLPQTAGQKHVLVVEDDRRLRELYRSALQSDGFFVIAVDDGFAALRAVENERPLAVVLDLDLPRLGGRDVEQELRSRPTTQHIPIIVVTGTEIPVTHQFRHFLQKPVDVERLVAAVRRAIHDSAPHA